MRKRTQHITAFLLSAALLLPLLAILCLQGWQVCLKREAWQRLKDEPVQTLVLPVAAVYWEEEGRELMVEGQMYDVVSYTVKDGLFTATCIFDSRETGLLQFLWHYAKPQKGAATVIQLLLAAQCFIAFIYWLQWQRVTAAFYKPLVLFINFYTAPFLAIISPPPRIYFT